MGIPFIAKANPVAVTNSNPSGPGSLEAAVNAVNNSLGAFDEITFNAGYDINLIQVLPTFNVPISVKISGVLGLKIQQNFDPANLIFNAGISNLHFIGNDDNGNSNWYGSIVSNATIMTFEQQTPSTYPGILSGSVAMVYQGPGQRLTLSNASIYTGGSTIDGGMVNVGFNNALPIGGVVDIINNGTLEIGNGFSQTLSGLSGDGFVNTGNAATLEIASATNSTFGGIMEGAGKLIKQGTGVLTFTNSNLYTGNTDILNGTLKADFPNALPQTGLVTIGTGAILEIANNQTLESIVGNGGITILNTRTLTLNTLADGSFAGAITTIDSGVFVKTGTHTLTLSGLNSGNLQLANAPGGIKIQTGGNWNGPITLGAATLEMNGGTVTQAITGNALPTSILSITGTFTPMAAITDVGSINVSTGGNFIINPGFVPTGFTNLTVSTGGILSLGTHFTVPAAATVSNTGTFAMNGFNLFMGDNSILNTGTLSTSGSIRLLNGIGNFIGNGTEYVLNVQTGETLTVNNPISGYTALTVANGASVILNPGGSLSNGITLNNSTFTFNGGTYIGNVVGGGGSVMNVNSALVAPGIITIDTLNINSGTTFISSNPITTNAALNIRPGATLFLINDIGGAGGTVVNEGTLTHIENSIRNITGNFRQEATGTIDIGITNTQHYSQFHIGGNTVLNGGLINVRPLSKETIQSGSVFDIIISDGGLTSTTLPTVPRLSLFLGFTPVINGNKFQLIANRIPFRLINHIPSFDGIATGLDNLSQSNPLSPLIRFADGITSQDEFETLLDQLAPAGLNGMYSAASLGATDQILLRLDTMREKTGYTAGDMMDNRDSAGPLVFGNSARQSIRAGVPGFHAYTEGLGIVKDVSILEYYRIGLGATYANSTIDECNRTGSHTRIGNTQALVYGSATYDAVFLDAVLSGGMNHYNGKRNIVLLGESVRSHYKGFQYIAKVKTGCTIPCYCVEISPTATLYYLFLNINRYREHGAPNVNLSVNPTRITAARASFGGRIADIAQEACFLPEIHAYYTCDFKNPNAIITSQFIAGGGSFISRSAKASRSGVNVGGSISSLMSENFLISGHYDFEGKTTFKSHSLSFKFKYLF